MGYANLKRNNSKSKPANDKLKIVSANPHRRMWIGAALLFGFGLAVFVFLRGRETDDWDHIDETPKDSMGVQLWAGGPYWAECNIGATKPTEYGYYFWWGDTVGYQPNENGDGWKSVKDGRSYAFESASCPTQGKTIPELQSLGYIDATGNLMAAHDAATVHLGAPWRMPTDVDFHLLLSNCTTKWIARSDVYGLLVTGKGAFSSQSIFLPAAGTSLARYPYGKNKSGLYWSATPALPGTNYAWDFYFLSSGGVTRWNGYDRSFAMPIRPIRGVDEDGAQSAACRVAIYQELKAAGADSVITLTNLSTQPHRPWNGLFDVFVTIQGDTNMAAQTECTLAVKNCATKTLVNISSVRQEGTDSFCEGVCTRRFNVRVDGADVTLDDLSLTIGIRWKLKGVQLWENGPYWAECNVGASKPEECGYYFWWGDTVGYKRNANNRGWISVEDGSPHSFEKDNCPTYDKSKSDLLSRGWIGSMGNLVDAHDAATKYFGAPWRMPTSAEITELINRTVTIWTTRNGIHGRLVSGTGAYASKSIFLPAAGCGDGSTIWCVDSDGFYWSSTPHHSFDAWHLYFCEGWGYFHTGNSSGCNRGQSIRPVRGFGE